MFDSAGVSVHPSIHPARSIAIRGIKISKEKKEKERDDDELRFGPRRIEKRVDNAVLVVGRMKPQKWADVPPPFAAAAG